MESKCSGAQAHGRRGVQTASSLGQRSQPWLLLDLCGDLLLPMVVVPQNIPLAPAQSWGGEHSLGALSDTLGESQVLRRRCPLQLPEE